MYVGMSFIFLIHKSMNKYKNSPIDYNIKLFMISIVSIWFIGVSFLYYSNYLKLFLNCIWMVINCKKCCLFHICIGSVLSGCFLLGSSSNMLSWWRRWLPVWMGRMWVVSQGGMYPNVQAILKVIILVIISR